MNTFMISPGSTTGLSALASSLMLSTATPRSCATLFRLKSLVTIFPDSVRASSISLRSTSRTSGKSTSEITTSTPDIFWIFCRMSRPRRPRLRFIESDESATSCSSLSTNCGITSVPSMKPVSQRSATRLHQRAIHEAGVAEVGDAAVDDHRGVENLVVPGRAGGAEQRHQPRRLEPLALARADDQAEVRKEQQDEAVQERDALIAVIDPEQRFADALGEEQPDGATEESAEQLRDRGVAELPLEGQRYGGQTHTERQVNGGVVAKRPQHECGIGHCSDECEPDEYEPGHMNKPHRAKSARWGPHARGRLRGVWGNLKTCQSSRSSASPTERTPTNSALPTSSLASIFDAGSTIRVNPICSASRIRRVACATPRTSPPRPTSPNTAVPCAIGRFLRLDATAATMPRSTAGSSMLIPPAMLTNTSSATRCSPARFSSTASKSDKRF